MEQLNINRSVAVLTLRMLLGFTFLMQGAGKVLTWGVENMYSSSAFKGAYSDLLPDFVIYGTAYYTSYVEMIGGALLVLGLRTNYALYALASVLIIVTFGHGLTEPIWDMQHVIYRAVLLIPLLLLPQSWDRFSIDRLMAKK